MPITDTLSNKQTVEQKRKAQLHHYQRAAKRLFRLYWSWSILGHVVLILGLHFWYRHTHSLLLFVLSGFLFHYYLLAMQVLRRERLAVLLTLQGLQQKSAEEILAPGKRFALYLRGFDYENSTKGEYDISEGMGEETETLGIRVRPGHVESFLTKMLHKDISLLTLADPQNPSLLIGAHRFFHAPEDWVDLIEKLMAKADIIFFYMTSFTPGVRRELVMLMGGRWMGKTILIFGREFPFFFSNPLPNEKPWLPHEQFPYVVYETGKKQWLRKHERRLWKNIFNRLSAFEAQTGQYGKILSPSAKKISHVTPSRWLLMLNLLIVSSFWFVVPAIFLIKMVYADKKAWEMPVEDLGILWVIYYFIRIFKGLNLQDVSSDEWLKEDKIKDQYNSQTYVQAVK